MKTLVIATFLALFLIPGSSALDPGVYRIRITANPIQRAGITTVWSLWNLPTYKNRLGTGFVQCTTINSEFSNCNISMRLTRGQIVARAVVVTQAKFQQYAITGGTGFYSNTGGILSIQPLDHGTILILIDIISF